MPLTLTQLRNKADTKLLEIWNAIAARQEAYRLKNGKYFQLLATADVVDGADTVLEIRHPNDERYLADVQLSYASPVPFKIMVDEWGNDVEQGFKATVVVELVDGRKFTRSRSLTDTRVVTQDYDPDTLAPVGSPYFVGADPVIETTAWEEVVVEPQI